MISVKEVILNKIKEYDSIVIGRHFRPDGDAVGSTMGLGRIISLTFPEKKVYLSNNDKSDYMAFLGYTNESVSEEIIKNSLVIIIDTATEDRVSDNRILNGKEVVKIDHHIEAEPYGDVSWVEDWRSSSCEMIASFYEEYSSVLKIDDIAATAIYAGMVTDSGRFRFSSTSSETLRLASIMVGKGVDIERLQANLDLNSYNFINTRPMFFPR